MNMKNLDGRQKKGRMLAKDERIKRITGVMWAVPSQAGDSAYLVNEMAATCSCPDHVMRREKCKHVWAVEIVKAIETAPIVPRPVPRSEQLRVQRAGDRTAAVLRDVQTLAELDLVTR